MKKIIVITLIILFSCRSKNTLNSNPNNIYSVIKIDSIGKVYLFYLTKNDSIFKVMSKQKNINNLPKIKIGKSYKMKLHSYFLPEEYHIKQRVSGVKFNGEMILLERDSIVSDLFISENFIGKFYLK